MNYTTVYEVSTETESIGTFWVVPIVFILIGIAVGIFGIKSDKNPFTILFGFLFSFLSLLFSILYIPATVKEYHQTLEDYEQKKFYVVEGPIEKFIPMPFEGHAAESFVLKGITFKYSDYDHSHYGFNTTASHGGPITSNGQQVRLSYIVVKGDNVILKVELGEP